MKLSLVLLFFLSSVRAEPDFDYNGFDHCNVNGWYCISSRSKPGYEIEHDCSHAINKDTRIWIWTARFPDNSHKLTIKNCNIVELHVDCTRYKRNTAVTEFRAINIKKLKILGTSTGLLHDNAMVTHFPPFIYMENVTETSFYKTMFNNGDDVCEYNVGNMKKMVLKRVGIRHIPSFSFFNKMEALHWSHVTVGDIEQNAMEINGSITIEDSHFSKLPQKAMKFNGEKVIFRRNTIEDIDREGITVYSFVFNLTDNIIKDITKQGLNVSSSHVNIERNIIHDLGKGALEGIGPSIYAGVKVFSLSYTFAGNEIEFLGPFSLHNMWTAYENSCTKITLENNKFDCDCHNVKWLYSYMNDKKNLTAPGFYKLFLNSTHNCGTSYNCTLSSILPYVCQNKTTLEENCKGFQEKENFTFTFNTTELNMVNETDDYTNWDSLKPKLGDTDSLDDSNQEKMILGNTYFNDNSNGMETSQTNFPVWIIVLIFVFFATLNILAYITWYLKRRKSLNSIEICKYKRRGNDDQLIIKPRYDGANTECENISYED